MSGIFRLTREAQEEENKCRKISNKLILTYDIFYLRCRTALIYLAAGQPHCNIWLRRWESH